MPSQPSQRTIEETCIKHAHVTTLTSYTRKMPLTSSDYKELA